jgi:RNA polymerase sigma-70 factor (ECF subfamily)
MSALASNTARAQGPALTLRLVETADTTSGSASAETDRDLVMAARSGDRADFARLYERFAPMVHAMLLSRIDPADAEDLTQEVFLKALRRLHSLREPEAVGPWLASMARNRATTLVRWRLRLKRLILARPPSTTSAPGEPRNSLNADEVLDAIRALPEAYRETLLMRLVARMSGPEIALRTGLSHGSVRVNLTRGMKLLRERLGADLTGPTGTENKP